jgi:hypothetical protein
MSDLQRLAILIVMALVVLAGGILALYKGERRESAAVAVAGIFMSSLGLVLLMAVFAKSFAN